MSDVTIFAPSPTLTVTVEDHPQGSEIHVHAGGQGVWQARMLRRLGCTVTICCVLTGEIGRVLQHLLEDEGIEVVSAERSGRGSAYVHDRRDGRRAAVAEEEGDPIGRHELDDLYSRTLRSSADSAVVVLSGPSGERTVPADVYRRLAADLRGDGRTVIADLAGDRLAAALQGGIDVLKVSHEELLADGHAADDSEPEIRRAMAQLRASGARTVIVTRSSDPVLLLDDEGILRVTPPELQPAETRGAGDSLTAGVAAGVAQGESVRAALTLGVAAGALNVTRHGLGTGDAEAIRRLRAKTVVEDGSADDPAGRATADVAKGEERLSPDALAARAAPVDDDTDAAAASPRADAGPRDARQPTGENG